MSQQERLSVRMRQSITYSWIFAPEAEALENEIADLRRDRERLDWLAGIPHEYWISLASQSCGFRQAIDAAMQAEQAKEEGAHFAKRDTEREKRRRDGESTDA